MNYETIHQPVLMPTLADRLRDFYWSNREACDASIFFGVIALVVTVLVQMA